MKSLSIIGLCIASAVLYGILHDQITARVCVEYFTIGHPPIFPTESPTLLGLGWGIVATWWAGLILGVPLAIAARAGRRPKREARSLVRPIAGLLLVMAAGAAISGVVGYLLAINDGIRLVDWLAERVPPDRHARFLADGAAHLASYGLGFLGGTVVIVRVWRLRGRPDTTSRARA